MVITSTLTQNTQCIRYKLNSHNEVDCDVFTVELRLTHGPSLWHGNQYFWFYIRLWQGCFQVRGDRNALQNEEWGAMDSVYMYSGYTQHESAQHTMHTMTNGTRSSSSTSKPFRNSGASSGRDNQTCGASSGGTNSDGNVWQRHWFASNNGRNKSSEGQRMSDCDDDDDDDDDEPLSARQWFHI